MSYMVPPIKETDMICLDNIETNSSSNNRDKKNFTVASFFKMAKRFCPLGDRIVAIKSLARNLAIMYQNALYNIPKIWSICVLLKSEEETLTVKLTMKT